MTVRWPNLGLEPRQLVASTAVLAGLSIAVALGGVAVRWLKIVNAPPPAASAGRFTRTSKIDLQPILTLAPFGDAIGAEGDSPGGLVLKGLVQGAPGNSAALIAVGDAPARSYAIGDLIDGRSRLVAVELDHAVLRLDSGLQRLGFSRAASTASSSAEIPPSPPPPPPALPPQALASGVGGEVAAPGGAGFTLGQAPWPELQRVGLRPGDTIAAVNGLPVGDMERDVVDAIASGKSRIEVIRDGRRIVLPATRERQ